MGKQRKNRQRKINIFIAREGDREEDFLIFLQEVFDPEKKFTLHFPSDKGGNSNVILDRALKSFHSKIYAWFDEDGQLDEEHKEILEERWDTVFQKGLKDSALQSYNTKKRNPIVIVSTPMSVEGIIIRLFDHKIPKLIEPVISKEDFEENKKRMKSSVKGFMGNSPDIEYYRKNLTKDKILEKAGEIEELELLLSIFDIRV